MYKGYNKKLNWYWNFLYAHKFFFNKKNHVKKFLVFLYFIYKNIFYNYDYRYIKRNEIFDNLLYKFNIFFTFFPFFKKIKFLFFIFYLVLKNIYILNTNVVILLYKYVINFEIDYLVDVSVFTSKEILFLLLMYFYHLLLLFINYFFYIIYLIYRIFYICFLIYKFLKYWKYHRGTKMGDWYKWKLYNYINFYVLRHFDVKKKHSNLYYTTLWEWKLQVYSLKVAFVIWVVETYIRFFVCILIIYPIRTVTNILWYLWRYSNLIFIYNVRSGIYFRPHVWESLLYNIELSPKEKESLFYHVYKFFYKKNKNKYLFFDWNFQDFDRVYISNLDFSLKFKEKEDSILNRDLNLKMDVYFETYVNKKFKKKNPNEEDTQ